MSFLGKWRKSSKAYWPTPTRWATLASLPLIPIVIIHILLLWQLPYIAWPENFVWPHLNLSGLIFYKDIFLIYPPFYALLLSGWGKLVGISLFNLQVISYLVIAITDWLLFLAAKKKIWPVLIYIPLQIFFEGNGLWPDQLLAPIFLAAFLLCQKKKYFCLGIAIALALLTKQTAVYFALGIGALLLMDKTGARNWARLLAGAAVVLAMTGFYFLANQNFAEFWEQTIVYIFSYHVGNSLQTLWPNRSQLLAMGLFYFPAVLIGLRSKRKELFLAILASLGIFTRFEYFHLQPALPFIAMLLASSSLSLPFVIIFLLLFSNFFYRNYHAPPRFYTPEILSNAAMINTFIPKGSKTLIINAWDHYYYLTGTLPVGNFFFSSTPWNWSYGRLQEKEVSILEKERPEFVVYGSCFWTRGTCHQPEAIGSYIRGHYQEVLKLADGASIFKNNPVGTGEKIQTSDSQK